MERNTVAQISTTKPHFPVHDGNSQYFLDWGRNKPCLLVDSFWEDCQYRIETLNFLLSIANDLVSICLTDYAWSRDIMHYNNLYFNTLQADGLKKGRRDLRLSRTPKDEVSQKMNTLVSNLVSQLK